MDPLHESYCKLFNVSSKNRAQFNETSYIHAVWLSFTSLNNWSTQWSYGSVITWLAFTCHLWMYRNALELFYWLLYFGDVTVALYSSFPLHLPPALLPLQIWLYYWDLYLCCVCLHYQGYLCIYVRFPIFIASLQLLIRDLIGTPGIGRWKTGSPLSGR